MRASETKSTTSCTPEEPGRRGQPTTPSEQQLGTAKTAEQWTGTSQNQAFQQQANRREDGGGGGEPGAEARAGARRKKQAKKAVLNILYLNARSLKRKVNDLELLADDEKPDLILITETWLNPTISTAELNISNYYIEPSLRHDRTDTVNGIGGGLLCYIRNGLTVLPCDNNSAFNQYCNFKILNNDKSTDWNLL